MYGCTDHTGVASIDAGASSAPPSKAPDRPDFHRGLGFARRFARRKLRVVFAGWDNANVVQPDGYGQARGGWEADLTPLTGSDGPPEKLGPPS